MSDEALMAAGFLAAPVALLVLSRRRVVNCNSAASVLFGWPREEMIGQSVRPLYPSHFDYETIGARWREWLRSSQHHQDERFMRMRSGEVFWAGVHGRTLTPQAPFELTVWRFERLAGKRPDKTGGLTPREGEIAQHIVNGRSCKEIGKLLNISHRTVEFHRAGLMRKLGAKNTADLVSKIIVVG